MALIVESGTGSSTANSYVTLDTADTYHEDRNNTDWAGANDTQKEAALIKAAMYLEAFNYRGIRSGSDQSLAFPRTDLYDDEGYLLSDDAIPQKIKNAQMEAALREIQTADSLQPDYVRGGRIKRKKIDVLETEYFDSAPAETTFTAIKTYLKGLILNITSIQIER